jgi:uncharacterized protein YlxW (UPF0749 family)
MTPRHSGAPSPLPARHYDDLLTQIMGGAIDPDYRVAAARRDAPVPGRSQPSAGRTATVAAVAAFGVLIGVSALQTEEDRPAQVAERAQLVAQIHSRQTRLADLHSELTSLQEDVSTQQLRLGRQIVSQRQLDDQVTELATLAGATEVAGPGVTVTVDDAEGSGSGLGGVVRDSDLQLLANGLWQAGAEAISINGQRLTTLTSIRYAGRAITVNYRSLTPPYVVQAIGDPDTLAARLLQSDAGSAWVSLRANYGIGFDIETSPEVTLPADPHASLRYAREEGVRR